MSDLTEFLLARIAEDEEVARDFVPEEVANPPIERQRWIYARNEWVTIYDPARVLAECEARRRIVAVDGDETYLGGQSPATEMILRLLALPYADHPDYRQEWRP